MRKILTCLLLLLVMSMTLAPLSFAASETEATLTPIYSDQLVDGTYDITVSSSSSMFRITSAQLIVEGENMHCIITLGGQGYEKLYMGTGDEALMSSENEHIYFVEDSYGMYKYDVPVEALDLEVDCAAWSFNKEKWYERILVFESSMLDESAFAAVEEPGSSSVKIFAIAAALFVGVGIIGVVLKKKKKQ